ncbi:MAG: hypothetical protein ACTSQJ_06915 [Promethearchaeota archaeon]
MFLSTIDFINGLLSTLLVVISVFIGIKISLKYRLNKDRTFLFFGITWILLVEPWYPSMISFLLVLTMNKYLPLTYYLFIGIVLIPFGIFTGVTAFTELLYKKRQKLLQIIVIITGSLFEIAFLYLLFTKPTMMGTLYIPVDIEFSTIVIIFLLANGPICVICGVLFARESLKSENLEVKLKGKLLVVAFTCFATGAIMEVITTLVYITLVARILLIIGAFFFYSGFILPDWMKNILIKVKQ